MILIRGAGDIASGIAVRLYRSGFTLAMTDLNRPTSIRRTVCFSEAIIHDTCTVEGVTAEGERVVLREEGCNRLQCVNIPCSLALSELSFIPLSLWGGGAEAHILSFDAR